MITAIEIPAAAPADNPFFFAAAGVAEAGGTGGRGVCEGVM
jgi:hypothetical protein